MLRSVVIHDVFMPDGSAAYLLTSAEPVACHVCGRGLEDGCSLSADSSGGRTVLRCGLHAR